MTDYDRCESFHPLLYDNGIEQQCERLAGHARTWHQYTDGQGRRTQWSWSDWELAEFAVPVDDGEGGVR